MSFGFGVGDFIAVGELCWKLYSQVYEVSRGAPEAIQNLKAELGDMHLTINKLVEDTKDPDSILVQSGSDRLNLACSVLEKTRDTLKKLDDLSGKYDLLQKPSSNLAKRHFWKRNYDKVKFAAESRTINDLRAKLVFHNGQISLLLQIVQSSSLERIENMQKKTENALEDIKAALSRTGSKGHTPLLSDFHGADQHRMTRKLMEKAEVNGRSWTSIGIRDWLQTGKWWLLKAQSQLYSADPSAHEYSQAWVDLIKASWILTDIIAVHPQRGFLGSGIQEMDIIDIVQAVKVQHEGLEYSSLPRPAMSKLESSDWGIWISTPSTALLPNLGESGPSLRQWGTLEGVILFQKFAILHIPTGTHECILFLEGKSETFTLIAQGFGGQDLYRHSVPDQFDVWKTRSTWSRRIPTDNVINLHDGIQLELSTRDDFLTAFLLTCGAKLYAESVTEVQYDETLIYTMALLDILSAHSPDFDEELRVIKPRTEELINNIDSRKHSNALWDLMHALTLQQLDYWKSNNDIGVSCKKYRELIEQRFYAKFIIYFSESLEQCGAICSSFPRLIPDRMRTVIDAANSVCKHGHAVGFEMLELLDYTSNNQALTHEFLDAFSHLPTPSDVLPSHLAKRSLVYENWYGFLYLVTKDGSIGINDHPPAEIWNIELALQFMDGSSPPLALLDERPRTLEVFKAIPYLTTITVIMNGLSRAAPRLSSRGLLDPNLPTLVNGDGVDVLSGLDGSGGTIWPLCMAINLCSGPEIIRSLCQAGAHLGGDDEALYSDLEVYKALLPRSVSQAQENYKDAITLVRAAVHKSELVRNKSMLPQLFISTDDQRTSLQSRWSYIFDRPSQLKTERFERRWKQPVLAILQETQARRNELAWLRANATISSAFE